MIRVSSDWTLFYRFFLPIVWIVFFGVMITAAAIDLRIPLLILAAIVICYLAGVLLLLLTFLRLKRVECEDTYFYVTNYFRTYRYTYDSVARMRKLDFVIFAIIVLRFKDRTSFGRRIYFMRRRQVWDEQVALHPELLGKA